jgi:hypothetical protein
VKSSFVRAVTSTVSVALLAACGGFTGTPDTTPLTGSSGERVLVPAGYGTLAQDEFTLTLQSGPLQAKVTPLAESVIRLAAPDTYERLAGIAGSARTSLLSASNRDASLFLVSFFSREPTVRYEPESIQIVNGGLRYRPTAIHAVTPGWGGQRLRQEETQIAVYAFDRAIDLELTLAVEYEGARDTSWEGILNRLELERARVRGRVGGGAISPDPSETAH